MSRPPKRGGKPTPRKFAAGQGRQERRTPPPRARSPRPQGPRQPIEPGTDRLNKILAQAGLGSRRAVEEFILQGRVTIDGQVVRDLATRVDPDVARIELDGEPIKTEKYVYFAVNKPKGYVSTNNDPAGRPRVVDLLPEIPQRVYTVGRLDENSSGLILLTNDGELANRLTHPRYGVDKVYHALVAGTPEQASLDKLVEGVWLAEGKARAKRARIIGKRGDAAMLEIILAEGKNREVRRVLAKLGHKVMSLSRVAVGPIGVKGLKTGEFRPLTPREVGLLRQLAEGVAIPTADVESRPDRRGVHGPARGVRGPARAERPPGNAARGRGLSASAGGTTSAGRSAEPGSGPPERPKGPRTGSTGMVKGPSGRHEAEKPPGTRRPPARRSPAEEGQPVIPLPEDAPAAGRRIIGLPSGLREPVRGPRVRAGSAPPRPPGRRGPTSKPRPSGPSQNRDEAGSPPKARRKSSILRRPRRPRPGSDD